MARERRQLFWHGVAVVSGLAATYLAMVAFGFFAFIYLPEPRGPVQLFFHWAGYCAAVAVTGVGVYLLVRRVLIRRQSTGSRGFPVVKPGSDAR